MTEFPATWTITDLARLAAAALAAGSPTQPNGRIREVPDVRTIRWYTSIGLLDRPAAMRGRTALYGRLHLAQLVAIKRLQAEGLTVAAVQERLLGADASTVEEIAMLPAGLDGLDRLEELAGLDHPAAENPPRARFWAAPVAPHAARERPAPNGRPAAPNKERDQPAEPAELTKPAELTEPTEPTEPTDVAQLVHGIRLAADITLLLPPGRQPDPADRAAIAEAARPLLDLLNRLGLTGT